MCPLVHPLMVAKMASTIDHVTNGRFALNVVCGWFKNEFDMFGAHMRPTTTATSTPPNGSNSSKGPGPNDNEFDFDGENFHARNV